MEIVHFVRLHLQFELALKGTMDTPLDESKCFEDQFVDNVDISQYDAHRLKLLRIEKGL